MFVTRVNHTLISNLYWKFLESNHKNSDFPILTLPVYLTKIFQSLNQCLAQLWCWKSVSNSQNLRDGSTAVLLETLFQDWSRAKHWFKHFSTLILSDFFLYFFCYQFWSGYENLLLRRWLQTWNQFTEWQIFVKNKKNLSLKVSFLRIRIRICLNFFYNEE